MVNILLVPTTSWVKHQNPNRLNFIFDHIAKHHNVYVMDYQIGRFKENTPRSTTCTMLSDYGVPMQDPGLYYIVNALHHCIWMKQVVIEKKIDVIVTANIIPAFIANFMGVPVVMDYLDHFEESAEVYYPDSFILSNLAKYTTRLFTNYNLTHADRVITVTPEFKKMIEYTTMEYTDTPIDIIPNGVDTSVLFPMNKENAKEFVGIPGKIIGYVGSLEHWVDLELVVTALHHIDATLMIVGASIHTDYAKDLLKFIEKEGLSDRVVFKGFIPYDRLWIYINAMDIGLNPLKDMKHNDLTVGGKVLNYIACDVPVVSSNASAILSLVGATITNRMIFTYNPSCRFEFIDTVNQLLGGAIVKDSTGQFNNAAVKYDWNTLSEQYEKVIEQCVGSRALYPQAVDHTR